MAVRAKTSFSLADRLFHAGRVRELSAALQRAHPGFGARRFERRVLGRFPELELKARIDWMVTCLEEELPGSFDRARRILLASLPKALDPSLEDDDFGTFIWVVPGEWIARHGCREGRIDASLAFLCESTQRFSAEYAVRPFLAAFPRETLRFLESQLDHPHYHVRRWISEGTRPLLPWAKRVGLRKEQVVGLLDRLHADRTRFVTRSVANHLGDWSKSDPDWTVSVLQRWQWQARQSPRELQWMTRHALRSQVKKGHAGSLRVLGLDTKADVTVDRVRCSSRVRVGDALTWQCRIRSHGMQTLSLGLGVHFLKANGKHALKMFRIGVRSLGDDEVVTVAKQISLAPMTTRVLYPGEHHVELFAGSQSLARKSFRLLAP